MSLVVSLNGTIKDYRDHFEHRDIRNTQKADTANRIKEKKTQQEDNPEHSSLSARPQVQAYQNQLEKFEKDQQRDFHAKDVMSSPVLAGETNWSVRKTIDYLKLNKISHLPVEKNESIVGIVSHQDLLGKEMNSLLDDCMSEEVIMARTYTTIREIAVSMSDHHISCLPVVETRGASQRAIVGIVTKTDLTEFLVTHIRLDFKG